MRHTGKIVGITAGVFVVVICCTLPLSAQVLENAPPPLKLMSKDETSRLNAENGLKQRTKLALELMDGRLGSAERLQSENDYAGVYRELGAFHAIMDDCLTFLKQRDDGGGKVLDNFKRLEIALRGFAPRLENLRREVPTKYEMYIGHLVKYLNNARSAAVEPMFADTVVPSVAKEH